MAARRASQLLLTRVLSPLLTAVTVVGAVDDTFTAGLVPSSRGGGGARRRRQQRRRMERDIHDGAQQQLVAMKIKLQLARSLLGAEHGEVDVLLAGVPDDASEAVATLRDLALFAVFHGAAAESRTRSGSRSLRARPVP